MSEMPEDIRDELDAALKNQLAQWGSAEGVQNEANERLLEVLRRAQAFELADSDGKPDESGEIVTPTSALNAALREQLAARGSGDEARIIAAEQNLAEAYRRFNNGEPPESQ
jgi:beta-glucosidase-like glycosyl hydrolase